jgi:hypothetical protein
LLQLTNYTEITHLLQLTNYTEITHLLQLTINVPKSHRRPQCTLQLVCERSHVVRLSWSSRPFTRAAASKLRASNWSPVTTFRFLTSLFIHPHKQKLKNLGPEIQRVYLGKRSEIDKCSCELFLSHSDWYYYFPKYWLLTPGSHCIILASDKVLQWTKKKKFKILC